MEYSTKNFSQRWRTMRAHKFQISTEGVYIYTEGMYKICMEGVFIYTEGVYICMESVNISTELNSEIEELILVYTRAAQLKISILKDTQYAQCCVICISNKVEYLEKEESQMGTRF